MATVQDKPSQMQVEAASPSDSQDNMGEIQKYNTINGDIELRIFADPSCSCCCYRSQDRTKTRAENRHVHHSIYLHYIPHYLY